MAAKYTIISTQPTIYSDPVKGVVNGVLVKFSLDDYGEYNEVRVPKMDAKIVKASIEEVVKQRDELAKLSGEK